MSANSEDLWYQLGYTLERARRQPTRDRVSALGEKLAAFQETRQGSRALVPGERRKGPDESADTYDWVLASIAGALVSRGLKSWPRRARPGVGLLARSAASGAAAMIFQELAHALLSGDPEATAERSRSLVDRVISGTARGLVYGAVAEPRLPGPPVLRGLAFGTAEYFLSPVGGVAKVLGKEGPYGRIPILRDLLSDAEPPDDGYLEHLVFGLALALMAGTTLRASRADEDE